MIGFLSRLRRSVRGNVLIITAFALIPLIGLVGGGIDLSRLYLVKARLQHACDAGALAGRKAMGAGTWAQTSPNPPTIANQFFDGNFKSDGRASTGLTRVYTESSGKVTGTATVSVPMTIMAFFGAPTRTLTVYCAAQQQIPNTDVMFVLDTTGSMDCLPSESSCDTTAAPRADSKITTLKYAVKCFYESVTQLTTDAGCPSGTSTGLGINSSSQIRFGFVPYTMNVNVGRLLRTAWLSDSWNYQTRQKTWTGWSTITTSCANMPSNTTTTQYQRLYSGLNNSTCRVQQQTAIWSYDNYPIDVSGLKNGSSWNSGLTLPIGDGFTNKTVTWDGCIEERQTVAQAAYSPIPAAAYDLDIDTVPTAGSAAAQIATQWKPYLPGAEYWRTMTSSSPSGVSGTPTSNSTTSTTNYMTGDAQAGTALSDCPVPAANMTIWASPNAFDSYVDSLTPSGNTYHDIGMLWGARLLSPTGLFASANASTPTGGTIQRNMIFMTDGDATSRPCDYTAYGLLYADQRTSSTTASNLNSCIAFNNTLITQTNARLEALCTATKNKGINLYVISFGGTGIAADTKTRLQNCATDSNHYFDATDSSSLKSAFQTIAAQITQLRLVQ